MDTQPGRAFRGVEAARWRVAAMLAETGTGFIGAALLGRFLGPSLYGDAKVLYLLRRLFGWSQTPGAMRAIAFYTIRGHPPRMAQSRLLRYQAAVAATLCSGALVASLVLPALLHAPRLRPPMAAMAVLPWASAWEPIFTGALAGMFHFDRLAVVAVAGTVSQLTALGLGLAAGLRLGAVVLGFFASTAAMLVLGRRFSAGARGHGAPTGAAPAESEVARFAFWQTAGAFALSGLAGLNFIWVKAACGDAALAGQYAAAQSCAVILSFFWVPFQSVFVPLFNIKARADRIHEAWETFGALSAVVAVLCLPMVVLGGAASGPILRLVFGAAYRPAGEALAVLFCSTAAYQLLNMLAGMLTACSLSALAARISLGVVLAQCALMGPALRIFGLRGAAAALGLSCLAGAFVAVEALRRHLGARHEKMTGIAWIAAGCAAAAALAVVLALPATDLLRATACVSAYPPSVAAVWLICGPCQRERVLKLLREARGTYIA